MLTDSQARTLALLYALKPKTRIELTAIVFPAAGKTGDCAVHAADSRELLTTMRTAIDEPRGVSSRWKRKVMTTLLVANPQVVASLAPFNAMRQNPAPAGAKLSKNMSQFMTQSALDLARMLKQSRVQRNEFVAVISAASGCLQSGIPFDAKLVGDSRCAESAQQVARDLFKFDIAPQKL